jgi:hypothetical protein
MLTLDSELGVSPMEETQILYDRIIQRECSNNLVSDSLGNIAIAQQALNQLQQTLQHIEKSTEQLRQSAKNLELAITGRKTEKKEGATVKRCECVKAGK